MNKAKRNDPISSFDAAKLSTNSARVHRGLIRKALASKPGQTARELEKYMNYKLDYNQLMRRLGEVAIKSDKRRCETGLPSCQVCEWALA